MTRRIAGGGRPESDDHRWFDDTLNDRLESDRFSASLRCMATLTTPNLITADDDLVHRRYLTSPGHPLQ